MIMKTSLKKKKKGQVKNNITMLAGFSLFFGLNFLRSHQKKKEKSTVLQKPWIDA